MGMTFPFSLFYTRRCHISVGFLLFIDSKGNAKTSVCG